VTGITPVPRETVRYSVYTRPEERESAAAYQDLFAGRGLGSAFVRFLLGPVGLFLINTPLFLLPRRLRLQTQHRVLDIGCGRASALRFLTARLRFQSPPVGLDIAPSILEQAAADLGRQRAVELVAAAATRLPFAAESFDLVLSAHVVKHLNDDAMHRFLADCWRVLRPGGVLVVWEFAPTRSVFLNRFHRWALTRRVKSCRLRGYGDFVDIAVESRFADMEILELRPFLFPPIPRTGFLLRKGRITSETC
jgi:SAM-dependent methyltransferase